MPHPTAARRPFQVNDRVRLRVAIPAAIPAGTPGTVLQVYLPDAAVVLVRFDGYRRHHMVVATDLERPEADPPGAAPGEAEDGPNDPLAFLLPISPSDAKGETRLLLSRDAALARVRALVADLLGPAPRASDALVLAGALASLAKLLAGARAQARLCEKAPLN